MARREDLRRPGGAVAIPARAGEQLYNPVWTSGTTSAGDFALGVAAFLLLFMWQTPPWLVVLFCAIGGAALTFATVPS
jgi:hypothetical protein